MKHECKALAALPLVISMAGFLAKPATAQTLSEIAAYDPFNAVWAIDRNGDGVASQNELIQSFVFGAPGDYPLAYTPATQPNNTYPCATARTVIATYRPSTGQVFVDTNNSKRFDAGDQTISTGITTSGVGGPRLVPLVRQADRGNGECRSQLGFFSQAGSNSRTPGDVQWYFDMNFDGFIDANEEWLNATNFGQQDDVPFTMLDGNGNGSKIGVFRPATSEWFIDKNGNGAFASCNVDRCVPANGFGDLNQVGFAGPRSRHFATAGKTSNVQFLDANANFRFDFGDPAQHVGNIFTINVLGRFE